MPNVIKILMLLLFLKAGGVYPQEAEWTNYANTSRITSLMKDGEVMWVGTTGGVIRMNTLTGEKILYNKATKNYPGNYVTALEKTPEGIILIGTKDGGIGKFEDQSWESTNTENSILPVNYITSIVYGVDQRIWASTWGGGLVRTSGSTLNVYTTENSVLSSNFLYTLFYEKNQDGVFIGVLNEDLFWFSGNGGGPIYWGNNYFNFTAIIIDHNNYLGLANEGSFSQFKLDNFNDHLFLILPDASYINCISADSSNVKWLGTRGKGIYVLLPDTSWEIYDTSNSGLPGNDVRAIEADNEEVWIGTLDGGLVRYDGDTWTPVNTNTSAPFRSRVNRIFVDGNNNKWIGFVSDGIWKYDNSEWTNICSFNSGLSDNYVTSFLEDNSGNYWAGTYNGGLNRFDGSQWIYYTPSNSELSDTNIISLKTDSDNNLWIATWGGGLNRFDGADWEVYNTSNSEIGDNYIFSMCIDSSDNVWMGTFGNGLVKFNGNDWQVFKTENSGIPSNYVSDLTVDKDNNLWIGTWYDGMARYNYSSFQIFNSSSTSFPVDNISCISVDDSNNVYAGTRDAGITRFNALDTLVVSWKHYNRYNSGLISNKINSITEDKEGKTWIGFDDGIAVFDPAAAVGIKNDEKHDHPAGFSLSQNYPNPFNPVTSIRYEIREAGRVQIKVYDLMGQEVETLINEDQAAGSYSVQFNGSRFASGVYIYQLKSGDFTAAKKLILFK